MPKTQIPLRAVLAVVVAAVCLCSENTMAAAPAAKTIDQRAFRAAHLKEILLNDGLNEVEFYYGDGSRRTVPGRIIRMPTNTMGPADHSVYLTVAPANKWSITPVDDFGRVVEDDPENTKEGVTATSVRYFQGDLDGSPMTLLFVATRDFDAEKAKDVGWWTPTPVAISVYKFRLDGDAGDFYKVYQLRSRRRYVDANSALESELALPLPQQ